METPREVNGQSEWVMMKVTDKWGKEKEDVIS